MYCRAVLSKYVEVLYFFSKEGVKSKIALFAQRAIKKRCCCTTSGHQCHFNVNKSGISMDEQASLLSPAREFADKTNAVHARGSLALTLLLKNTLVCHGR